MGKTHNVVVTYFGVVIVALLLSNITPRDGLGGELERKLRGTSVGSAPFTLTIQDGLISLRATDASIKQILAELGHQMDIDVSVRLPVEERITLAFDQLPLMEAIKRFGRHVNYLVLEDRANERGKITRIIVFSRREAPNQASPTPKSSQALATPEGSRTQ
jgi:hypothetical protein